MPTLTWLAPVDKWHQKSGDGKYSVAKYGMNGATRYESWRTRAHPEGPHLLRSHLDSAETARAVCEQDAEA